MTGKTDRQFLFDVQLNWLADKRGILSAKDVAGTLHVATPPVFGGEGKPWSPEHLFLGSISSCYMTTLLAFAQKLNVEISRFECEVIGQVALSEGKYKFTVINLYPKIVVAHEALREKMNQVVQKTNKYCLITNSVNAPVYYHTELLVYPHTEKETHTNQAEAMIM